jgi:hypothetical protein
VRSHEIADEMERVEGEILGGVNQSTVQDKISLILMDFLSGTGQRKAA